MAKRIVPTAVEEVIQTLQTHGFEAVLVGGCVRDMLLSRPIHDYDVATNALPEKVVLLFERTRDTGIKHGTVTVITDPNCPVEVTTYRSETGYSDGRHPDKVTFVTTLQEDLSRRDFTMNAMALTAKGKVIDPFGGQTDLLLKRIRAVGNPQARFREDSLRILRAVRFAAELIFEIEPMTSHAMRETSQGLEWISRERIGQELTRVAKASWWNVIPILASGRLLSSLPDPLLRLQSCFERLAKVPVHRMENWKVLFANCDADTRWLATWGTWLLFADTPEKMARELFQYLAISSRDAKTIGSIASVAKEKLTIWPKARWRETLFQKGKVPVQIAARIRSSLYQEEQANDEELCSYYIAEQPLWSRKELNLTANELMTFGLCKKRIGQAFELLCQAVLSGECLNDKTNLMDFLNKSLVEGRV